METNDGIEVSSVGGSCPVQAEGTIDGVPFYFRARGEHWSIGIGGDVVGDADWQHRAPFGKWPDAGYMSDEQALTFIREAAEMWRSRLRHEDDGQPDEMTEWRDYDHDC